MMMASATDKPFPDREPVEGASVMAAHNSTEREDPRSMTELSRGDVAIGVKTSWVYGFLILLLAALIRLAFFRGALGTDEIVYLTQAQRLLNGDIGHAVYIGAVRYGINGFQALSIRLFGNGVAGAGGLYFLCWLHSVRSRK